MHLIAVSTPEAVHNISLSVHQASRQHHLQRGHNRQQLLSAAAKQHTSKLRAPQVKLGKQDSSLLPRAADLSIFDDGNGSPLSFCITRPSTTCTYTQSSTLTPVRKEGLLVTSVHGHDSRVVNDSVQKKRLRAVKLKVSKSSTTSSLVEGRTASSRGHDTTSMSSMLSSGYQCSPLAVHQVTAAPSGAGKRTASRERERESEVVDGAGVQEDKENVTPLLMAMPKAHDILADQVGR